ncbi:hypothetical protein [Fibrobacter sp.]|uniref:hypothetical protein n=1 Tax=Fibrobacter sp. TaxID=35828 RepID=UPI00388E2E89
MENEFLIKISEQLGSMNAYLKTALDKLAEHEKRIGDLEKGKGAGLKDDVIALAVKGLVIAIISLGSVVGAGTLITKIIGT